MAGSVRLSTDPVEVSRCPVGLAWYRKPTDAGNVDETDDLATVWCFDLDDVSVDESSQQPGDQHGVSVRHPPFGGLAGGWLRGEQQVNIG
jgi:hypothetical protein